MAPTEKVATALCMNKLRAMNSATPKLPDLSGSKARNSASKAVGSSWKPASTLRLHHVLAAASTKFPLEGISPSGIFLRPHIRNI